MARTIEIEIPVTVEDNTEPALSNITEGLENLDEASENATKSMGRMSKMERAAQKAMGTMKSAASWAGKRYQSVMEIKDMASPALSKITSGLKSFEKKAWTATFKVASAPLRAAASAVTSPLVAAGIPLSAGAAVGSSVKTYAGFEAQMSQVKAISWATAAEFDQLTAKAKEMGATTKFTAQEAGEAFNYMAMARWKPQQMLGGISGIMSLAAASGEDLGTTSDIVTDALTAFGLKAADAGHFSDVLAQASSNANTDVGTMGESFKYVAPVAGALGYSIEDTSLALGLMANASIKGSMAGTSLKTSLSNMASPTKAMATAMEKYGISLTDTEGNMKSMRGVMENLRGSLGNLSETEQTAAASTIFGKEAMAGMLAIINASEEDWNKLAGAVDNADGASQRMADTMLDNLSGKFTLFQSALDGVKISLGERVSPYLVEALGWITDKMPDVESALMRGMDGIDSFIDGVQEKIAGFTSTPEWQDAGLFGKMRIAWDGLVGDPLADWWSGMESTIKGKAAQIGETIGEGLSGGLLALLGFDIGEGVNEGVSLGASFARGFARGFDGSAVLGTGLRAIGGQFLNAGKLFTGDGDASSWASAMAIMRTGIPLISGTGKMVSAVKKAFGTETVADGSGGTVIVPGIGRKILGSAGQGTGLLGFGANTAIKLGAGNLAGGASLSAGAVSALGLGAVAGGIVGGLTLISGGKNFIRASKAEDPAEKTVNENAGVLKWGGVGAGAAIGFAAGGPVGALIGAGIGGLAGSFAGNKQVKGYEEKRAAEETMAAKSQYALEGARFETEGLADAFKDASVSADEFGVMMQEAASQKIQDGFGNIKLSMQDIKDAARQAMFPDGLDENLDKFSSAASQAGSSLANIGSDVTSLEKWNWRASLGRQFSDGDKQSYMSSIDSLAADASQYLEDKHFEAKMAIDLLVEPGTPVDMMSGVNSAYAEIESKVQSYSDEAKRVAELALEDGVVSPDASIKFTMDGVEVEMSEADALSTLQNAITEQVNRVSEAESKAGFQAIQAKYSGADLTYGSYSQYLSELSAQASGSIGTAEDAYKKGMANLNLAYGDDTSNPQYVAQQAALEEGFHAKTAGAGATVEAFGLETVANSFGEELDGILPQVKGTASEKISYALHDAWADGVDTDNWGLGSDGLSSAVGYLGLGKMGAETQAAVASMMGEISRSLPEEYKSLFRGGEMEQAVNDAYQKAMESVELDGAGQKLTESAVEDMARAGSKKTSGGTTDNTGLAAAETSGDTDLTKAAGAAVDTLGTAIGSIDMEKSGAGITEGIQGLFISSMENLDLGDAAMAFSNKFGEAMSGIDMSGDKGESGSGLVEGIQDTLMASMGNIDLSDVATSLNGKLGEAMSSLEMDESGGGLAEGITNSITTSLEGIDLSGVAESISVSLNEALSSAEAMDFSGFGESLSASLSASVSGMDYSGITSAVGTGISSAIEASMGTIQGAISSLYSQVGTAINSAFAAGFQTTTTVTITVNYQLANPTATISFSGGGTGTATVSASIASNAEGSIVNGRILSWVGEDGPEAIIPLGAKRRQRGIELWQQAGRMMGIHEYAEGGIVGAGASGGYLAEPRRLEGVFDQPAGTTGIGSMPTMPQPVFGAEGLYPSQDLDFPGINAAPIPANTGQEGPGDTAPNITIHVGLSPVFEVHGGGEESLETIKGHLRELADSLAGELAGKLSEIFENTPVI